MDLSNQNCLSNLPLNLQKNAESNFFYTLATANVDHLVPNMVLMYVTIRS